MGVVSLVSQMLESLEGERVRLDEFYRWFEFRQPLPPLPRKASEEQRALAKKARTPLLRLVVESTVEPLRVEGYRPSAEFENRLRDEGDRGLLDSVPFAWRAWMANGMGGRQSQVYRDAAIAGYAFVTVVPGVGVGGEDMPRIRPVSPRRMWAEYEDPYGDEFPMHAVQDLGGGRFRFFDDVHVVEFSTVKRTVDGKVEESLVQDGAAVEHGAGVCPVVRFENLVDSEGRCTGEVEPYIDIAARFDMTQLDKLLVQRNNSWKILYATGMQPPKGMTPEEQQRTKVRLRQDDMILAGSDVKFGQLDETSMAGFLTALNDELELLSAVSQTPTSVLSGDLVNLSADALAEARVMHTLKLAQRITNYTAEWGRVLRLACAVGGMVEEAQDYMAQVVWAEIEVRSLAQTVDAYGKLVAQLDVPPRGLWDKIPGVTSSDTARWERLATEKREEDLQIEAVLADIKASADGDNAPNQVTPPLSNNQVKTTLPTYENMEKPWARAARGGNRTTEGVKRKKLTRYGLKDGDGDGIVGE